MERLGIIGGSAFLEGGVPERVERRVVATERGDVVVHLGPGWVFLRRHGHDGYRPPHRIPHHAHALALESLGVRRAVGLCSVGSLDPRIAPGTVVVPDDYLSWHPPPTFAGDERLHIVPGLDPDLRRFLLEAARTAADRTEDWTARSATEAAWSDVRDGGVYVETRGPRFETRAEIRLLADYADVVGMTGASEATLLQEKGIAPALLGIVDNYAHGIGARPLTLEDFDAQLHQNAHRAAAILGVLMERAEEEAA
jgi:5'-methylthioadenosine phosphorylase